MDLSESYKMAQEAQDGKEFDLFGDGTLFVIRSTDSDAYQKSINKRQTRLTRAKHNKVRIQIMNECMAESLWVGCNGIPLTDDGEEVDASKYDIRLNIISKYRAFRNDLMRIADDPASFAEESDQD